MRADSSTNWSVFIASELKLCKPNEPLALRPGLDWRTSDPDGVKCVEGFMRGKLFRDGGGAAAGEVCPEDPNNKWGFCESSGDWGIFENDELPAANTAGGMAWIRLSRWCIRSSRVAVRLNREISAITTSKMGKHAWTCGDGSSCPAPQTYTANLLQGMPGRGVPHHT